jgi:transcriptional/translational regulatory protein YebC/TACO1
MEAALDAGADDVTTDEEGVIEVTCPVNVFAAVRDALTAKGLTPEMADIVMKPNNEVELEGDNAIKMQKLLDALESLDDVQEVYTNAVMDEQG